MLIGSSKFLNEAIKVSVYLEVDVEVKSKWNTVVPILVLCSKSLPIRFLSISNFKNKETAPSPNSSPLHHKEHQAST